MGGNITTTGLQSFGDAVVLTNGVALSGSNITFGNTIDGAFDLTLNSTAVTNLQGAIGATTALTSLNTNAGETTQLGGNITTTGAQTFNDAIALTANITADAGTANITFANTINGGFGLTLNSTGTTSLQGAIGATTALTSLSTNAGGTTQLGGDITTTGAQTFNDAIALATNVTIDAATSNITFADTINGAFGLTLNSTGTTNLQGAIGGTTALASLTTSAGGTTQLNENITTTGNKNV